MRTRVFSAGIVAAIGLLAVIAFSGLYAPEVSGGVDEGGPFIDASKECVPSAVVGETITINVTLTYVSEGTPEVSTTSFTDIQVSDRIDVSGVEQVQPLEYVSGDIDGNGFLETGEVWLFSGSYPVFQNQTDTAEYSFSVYDSIEQQIVGAGAGISNTCATDVVDPPLPAPPELTKYCQAEDPTVGDSITVFVDVSHPNTDDSVSYELFEAYDRTSPGSGDFGSSAINNPLTIDAGDVEPTGILDYNEVWSLKTSYVVESPEFDQAVFSYFVLRDGVRISDEIFTAVSNECFTDVQPLPPSLTFSKTPVDGRVMAGAPAEFAISVTNAEGAGTAFDVNVFDGLPSGPGIDWQVTDDGGAFDNRFEDNCLVSEGSIDCEWDEIPPGESRTIVVSTDTIPPDDGDDGSAGSCGIYENTAEFYDDSGEGDVSLGSATGSITVQCAPAMATEANDDDVPITLGDSITDTAILESRGGDGEVSAAHILLGPVTGSVSFFVCTEAELEENGCESGGTPVGAAVDVEPGDSDFFATSEPYETDEVGLHCFRAEYYPDEAASSQYLFTSHTNLTTECFEVVAPNLTIEKRAGDDFASGSTDGGFAASDIDAGQDIIFGIRITNQGAGIARNVAVTDQLPRADELDWNLGNSFPPYCSIVGEEIDSDAILCVGTTEDPFELDPGQALFIEVRAASNDETCGTFTNDNAAITADNDPDGAVAAPATETVHCTPGISTDVSPDVLNDPGDAPVTDTATLTEKGDLGPVLGTVDFYLCGPTLDPTNCDSELPNAGVVFVGTGVIDDFGVAVSPTVDPSAISVDGWYCFRAEYVPEVVEEGSPAYLPTSHTNATTECFERVSPSLTFAKTVAGNATINAGDPGDLIRFTITVTNDGTGTANDVVIADNLPDGAGVSWSVASETLAGVCTTPDIDTTAGTNHVLRCNALNLLPDGGSYSVTVQGTTTAASCGIYGNEASYTSTNAGSGDSALVSVTVRCAPNLTTAASVDILNSGDPEPVVDRATVRSEGTLGQVTGTITFSLCGPDADLADPATAAGCDGGTQIGDPVPVDTGNATSATVESAAVPADLVDTNGTYCFRADFSPSNANYLPDSHTDGSLECFDRVSPGLNVVKTPNGGAVNGGQPATFAIEVGNTGGGSATDVRVQDALEGGPGIAWSVIATTGDPVTTGSADDCAVTGAPGSQVLDCTWAEIPAGATFSISVGTLTTAESCGVYDNTAIISSSNTTPAQDRDSGQITVRCAPAIDTLVSRTLVTAGETEPITDLATVTEQGDLGDVLGSIDFYLCGPTVAAADCRTGAFIGTVPLTQGAGNTATAVSPNVLSRATTDGFYCFRAAYRPAAGGNYLGVEHVDDAGECFRRVTANVTLTKTVAEETVAAGDPISFTLTATNSGLGVAQAVDLADDLPDGPGLVWSVAEQSVADLCNTVDDDPGAGVDFVLECNPTDLAAGGGSVSVTVEATTTEDSCDTYANTATFASANAGSGSSAEVSVTVQCPDAPAPELPSCDHTATFDIRGAVLETLVGDKIFTGTVIWEELGNRGLGCFVRVSFDGTLQDVVETDGTPTVSLPQEVSGSFTGYMEPLNGGGVSGFQTAETFALVLDVVESWNVPGVAVPAVPITAVVTVTGPVVSIDATGISATVVVDPPVTFPLTASASYVVVDANAEAEDLPNTGTGPQYDGGTFDGLLPSVLGVMALLALAVALQQQLRDRLVRVNVKRE